MLKGMDIVLGGPDKYFVILIRSMIDIDSGELIEGPCKCVNVILELLGFDNVQELFDSRPNKQEQIDLDDSDLRLEPNNKLEPKDIFTGTRIGLSDKYLEYKNKPYRFVIYQEKIKKEKKI
jgi:3-methyladenine DNA glycosylase Mpg